MTKLLLFATSTALGVIVSGVGLAIPQFTLTQVIAVTILTESIEAMLALWVLPKLRRLKK